MKIQFDSNLDYQLSAIKSVVNIFEGQERCETTFTVRSPESLNKQRVLLSDGMSYGNRITISDSKLLENIQRIQNHNGLPLSACIDHKNLDFTIEMETGTGKTYVYLRTIVELYKIYGFSKHIIVVPSIAIKEGVKKSLEITQEHISQLYGIPRYDFFNYDGNKPTEVYDFATNDSLRIMVINVQSFIKNFTNALDINKNIFHRYNDELGCKPSDLIQNTNPIVIIDEPQSSMSTERQKRAIKSLNPLAMIRYSATHREKINLMYKLDAIDAYQQKLVKQIEVGSVQTDEIQNQAYIKLLEVRLGKGFPKAKIELDIFRAGVIKRKKIIVKQNDDLKEITNLEEYEGYIINDIDGKPENEYIDFTRRDTIIRIGNAVGNIDDDRVKSAMISKTIQEHLDKEILLNKYRIKVLTLFFVDKVLKYRDYDEEGNPKKGLYAEIFEKEYEKLIRKSEYNFEKDPSLVHKGYFSKDRLGRLKDTGGKSMDDANTYNLIMRSKERLLSFDEKTRFIFSHSALREGWDNPNVFQICSLRDLGGSSIAPRQQIGRGLRLCVDQSGMRVYGRQINTLSVIANESYKEFAERLQKDIENETGIRFGLIQKHDFENIQLIDVDTKQLVPIGPNESEKIYKHFVEIGYINLKGKINDYLITDLNENKVDLPSDIKCKAEVERKLISRLSKVTSKVEIKNRKDKRKVTLNNDIIESKEFKSLWDRIKYKTSFSVNFNSDELVEKCIEAIDRKIEKGEGKLYYTKAIVKTNKDSVLVEESFSITHTYEFEPVATLPDIVGYLQNGTNLTRKTIIRILVSCDNLDYFKLNPRGYIEGCLDIIKTQMQLHIVNGIKYQKIGDTEIFNQELFRNEELFGYTDNLFKSKKSPYESVVCDSKIEFNFAEYFEKRKNVVVYAKLPRWFKIDTPLGSYNPDWAISWRKGEVEKLYFVVESKGLISELELRGRETKKIECGEKHFEALDVEFQATDRPENISLI